MMVGGAVLAVVNPAAGGGRCRKLAPAAMARLRESGLEVEIAETRAPGEGGRLAAAAYDRGVRRFVAVGGDGTAHEVLNGLLPRALSADPDQRVILGFLPLGTGNSFLRDFTDRGADHAVEALVTGRSRACDVLRLTHARGELFYTNILSMGFVADVATLANRRFKQFGAAGYALAVVVETVSLAPRSVRLRIDDGPWRTEQTTFISINNSRFTGGSMIMAPPADTADGKADVVIARAMGRLALLAAFPRIFAGTHLELPVVSHETAQRIEIDVGEPVDLMVDGEVVTELPRAVDVLPGAIQVSV